ncbi:hypothetical protein [Leptospira interrogans]|uniref:hypothetical protein n=1 Tax=Leptospira interrogans TaxID=173 RepID=UPI000297EE25|nr:hypothetical protein [Leptospira interrogans]EKR47022.1 hypothetical protein LEP1GSC097_0320 [Leptospira interrogans serovar Grippotyphosa str. UI 08368]
MGSMYKEQKKTNRILSEQTKSNEKIAKTNFELQNKQNAELERQTFLLELEQKNREYQKYLRDFIFEMKKFAEEIGSGKYSEIPSYTAARIVKTRITSEGISSQSFEQIQDKEFYSQAIESLDKVLESASAKAITEGDLYFEKYQAFLKSIDRKEFAKDYFLNWVKNCFYTLQPDGDEFQKKLNFLSIGLFSVSIAFIFFPFFPIVGGLIGLAVTYIWLQKRISKDYSALFSSLSIQTNSISGTMTFKKTIQAIKGSILESESELRKFRQSNFPEIEKYELPR